MNYFAESFFSPKGSLGPNSCFLSSWTLGFWDRNNGETFPFLPLPSDRLSNPWDDFPQGQPCSQGLMWPAWFTCYRVRGPHTFGFVHSPWATEKTASATLRRKSGHLKDNHVVYKTYTEISLFLLWASLHNSVSLSFPITEAVWYNGSEHKLGNSRALSRNPGSASC